MGLVFAMLVSDLLLLLSFALLFAFVCCVGFAVMSLWLIVLLLAVVLVSFMWFYLLIVL